MTSWNVNFGKALKKMHGKIALLDKKLYICLIKI